ncbi:reverse transcriptase family protein [Aureimonas phyllosphaerae]|uniref:Reverse transcriptase domain-containing protein n=1 Tax=Aureimonas phyllosphaerae TaxID=1166078 RepID=A0A7W6BU69_9HYPH|nr:reverse transcriptase family protein [Aureimonas phyllosphaerae]MBB3938093.1 hypothetical protein [Aureimonas phyllosphaerae]MBB3962100.1 hypothetical protein [Aureimonas phyllosphaerae]SFF55998.1 Reverse transcriptase (RNA-dependent DNA polymerase) [Aureimonas phyllosphaerae]
MSPSRYPLHQSPFYKLTTRKRLATILGTDTATIKRLANDGDGFYREFDVTKKSGGKRGVEEPSAGLKDIQSRIAGKLSRIAPPDYLFCPVKGRCYVSNASQHRGNRVVRCLDVRRYFPSTSFERVLWFFRSVMLCSEDVAWHLAKIATYKGHLPTGSPLSPIMAYYAHYDVWEAISAICKEHGYTLTVYIDDVTISGHNVSAAVVWSIKKAIHRAGLRYHKEKAYIDRPSEITGVIVDGDKLTVPNRQLQKLNRARRDLKTAANADDRKTHRNKVMGLSSQIVQVQKIARSPSAT